MKFFRFESLYQREGWLAPAYIGITPTGTVAYMNTKPPTGVAENMIEKIAGHALAGFVNAHSHAFQYAMAGLAEHHPAEAQADTFWSWREKMYEIALKISPEALEAIATQLYAEMLRHGYTHVAEFHYLHHDTDGNPYKQVGEMSHHLLKAADKAGIRITLLPVWYAQGGFGQEPTEKQRRFINQSLEDYLQLWHHVHKLASRFAQADVGFCVHSLRAVNQEQLQQLAILHEQEYPHLPFHIHIAEQEKEVEDCLKHYGKRPVEFLASAVKLSPAYQLVHATHLSPTEVAIIAKSGAQVVICPSTEGNLGDGFFALQDFEQKGGHWTIGTDSHVSLNPFEELRWLDYGQRLRTHLRKIFTHGKEADSAKLAYEQAIFSGRRAVGRTDLRNFFEVGKPFDALIIRDDVPLLAQTAPTYRLATILYSGDASWNLGTWVQGHWQTLEQQHKHKVSILAQFREATTELRKG
ncbi:MAG: formimidoylglutamate deiminase [Bacteroidetes bacterium]|nr:MAG: formimidoylglutamate deiminase [Bacteroidota bacterium]